MALVVDEKRFLEMQDMRKRHFTYHDIAEHFGISHQRVHQILSSPRKRNGKTNIEKIIYEGIYQLFSDDPTMTYRKFAKVVLFSDCNNTAVNMRNFFTGTDTFIQISEINKILSYIGKPFEEVFKLRKPK